MTPAERAALVYRQEECRRTFAEDLDAHLLNGWVISTPTVFVMARTVDSKRPAAEIVNPWVKHERPDCWMIYLFAGDLREAIRFFPYELPKIAFERENRLRYYALSDFLSKLHVRPPPS